MNTIFKVIKIINSIALLFLLLNGYGLPITGFLQLTAAILFIILFPKNKLIYIYFALVVIFFLFWDYGSFNWLFAIPIFLIVFLTFIIYNQKIKTSKPTTNAENHKNITLKIINKINYVLMAMPILFGLLGALGKVSDISFMRPLILLGIFQVGVALAYKSDLKENIHFKIYGYSVISYLLIAFISYWSDFVEINDPFNVIIFIAPLPALAIYFSIILYQKTKDYENIKNI